MVISGTSQPIVDLSALDRDSLVHAVLLLAAWYFGAGVSFGIVATLASRAEYRGRPDLPEDWLEKVRRERESMEEAP